MASKQPKPPAPQTPPNNNAKSLDRWDDEGGAPSGGQYRHKRAMLPEPKNPAAVGNIVNVLEAFENRRTAA
jgi:hypothetical protein